MFPTGPGYQGCIPSLKLREPLHIVRLLKSTTLAGEVDLSAAPSPAEALAVLYQKYRSVLPAERSAVRLAYLDRDGDWMLLQPGQPWPPPFPAVRRRLLLSTS